MNANDSMTTTERIVQMLEQRAATGLAKYGVTVDRDDLKLADWVRHAQEELLDAAQYLQRVADTHAELEPGNVVTMSRDHFATEIENAWAEGYRKYAETVNHSEYRVDTNIKCHWNQSRAKRVAEGRE